MNREETIYCEQEQARFPADEFLKSGTYFVHVEPSPSDPTRATSGHTLVGFRAHFEARRVDGVWVPVGSKKIRVVYPTIHEMLMGRARAFSTRLPFHRRR